MRTNTNRTAAASAFFERRAKYARELRDDLDEQIRDIEKHFPRGVGIPPGETRNLYEWLKRKRREADSALRSALFNAGQRASV